jgi:hypothetical protein
MAVVNFLAYQLHEQGRVEANDAMMALLVGSRLSRHILTLMDGSDAFLTRVFPKLPGVSRLHVPVPRARELLADSERHLALMAIPYSVTIHEDFLNRCIDMFCVASGLSPADVGYNDRKLGNIYTTLTRLGLPHVPGLDRTLFELVRRTRNQIVHNGAQAGDVLVFYESDAAISARWQLLAKRDLASDGGTGLRLEANELFACLAVLKRLADEMNLSLQRGIAPGGWAAIAVDHFASGMSRGNPEQTARRLIGFVRHNYGPIGLSDELLLAEANRRGISAVL